MKGFLIDPVALTIDDCSDERWPLELAYSSLSIPGLSTCDDINSVEIRPGVMLWVDGEGMLKPGLPVFRLRNYPHPLAGRGLVLGLDEHGATMGAPITQAGLKSLVIWTTQETTGEIGPATDSIVEHPIYGPTAVHTLGSGVLRGSRKGG